MNKKQKIKHFIMKGSLLCMAPKRTIKIGSVGGYSEGGSSNFSSIYLGAMMGAAIGSD